MLGINDDLSQNLVMKQYIFQGEEGWKDYPDLRAVVKSPDGIHIYVATAEGIITIEFGCSTCSPGYYCPVDALGSFKALAYPITAQGNHPARVQRGILFEQHRKPVRCMPPGGTEWSKACVSQAHCESCPQGACSGLLALLQRMCVLCPAGKISGARRWAQG